MNFEKIEMYGFKSFADKQEIKFGDGITGIVGPNGCGKSNVADAIRWVLGEQSAKTLRGNSMQDVIFNGTQDRKSLSYCEVSLFFDNSTKMFSIDYNELIITRKLYRSGESEYFINKQPARLKDIVSLLHECGIGKEGYTIIGQGKVQEIMSAKPEDRRGIFEEATGIAKFKGQKRESENKLERTRENLLRFNDIISELENQLGPLERQAEKTRQFRDLSAELKHHEINVYISKFDNVATEKGKINQRIKAINEETSLRQKEYDKAQSDYEKVFDEINSADQKLRKYNDELLEKRVGIEKSEGEAKLFNERISFLKSNILRAKEEIENNLNKITENNLSIENAKENTKKLSEQLKKINEEIKALNSELDEVLLKLTAGETEAEANRQKILESMASLSDINLNKGSLSAEKNALVQAKSEYENTLKVLSEKREELFIAKEKLDKEITLIDKSIYELRGEISEKEDVVRELNEKTDSLDNKIFNLNSNLSMLTAKENFVVGMKESYEGYAPAVKRLLVASKDNAMLSSKIKGVVASLIKTEAKYDIAIETALGAAAQNIVTQNPEDTQILIDYLKKNQVGRLTFLPITSVKPRMENDNLRFAVRERGAIGLATNLVVYDSVYQNVISNLLGNTLIVDNLQNATVIAKKYRFSFKIVTLDGDVLSTQGSMTGGSRRQDTPNLLAGDRQLEEIREKIAEKRKEMDALKTEKAQLVSKRDEATDELSILSDRYQSKKQELVILREKLTGLEESLVQNNKNEEEISSKLEEIDIKIEYITQKYEEIRTGSEKLEADRSEAGEKAEKRRAEYEKYRAERDALREKLLSLQLSIADNRSETDKLSEEIMRLGEENSNLALANQSMERDIENKNVIIENIKRDAERVALSREEQEYVNNLRKEIENIEESKKNLREKLGKIDEDKNYLSEQLNVLADKRHAEDISLTKIDSDIEYYGQRIAEEYEESYETALKYKVENYDAKEGEQEITKLKRRISSLGSINPNAIDDFASVKERYDEMIVQKEDLEKAESDIVKAIDTLKKEMLTKFNEGFTKINENFMKIFKELFGGGRAMLELDYENVEDPLDAGVNIIAEPPGKKLQKLSLLSGGEQALTAIAILFSILRLRPMPFCVLDEIEAALDEANVDRFARYLKKFSHETQFIVITHRKPTMELADALFGVTMQEKGVSKLVSVKLSDIGDDSAV